MPPPKVPAGPIAGTPEATKMAEMRGTERKIGFFRFSGESKRVWAWNSRPCRASDAIFPFNKLTTNNYEPDASGGVQRLKTEHDS